MLTDKVCENGEMKKCAEGGLIHVKWTTWEVGLIWVNWMEMSTVIVIRTRPNRI